MDMEKSGASYIPGQIKGSLARLHNNKSNLLLELSRLSKNYLFIGGAEHHDEHQPRHNVRLYDHDFSHLPRPEDTSAEERLQRFAVIAESLGGSSLHDLEVE